MECSAESSAILWHFLKLKQNTVLMSRRPGGKRKLYDVFSFEELELKYARTTSVYNMDHLPQSDNLSDLSEVVAETFGDDADKFIDEYVRQKERHKELFENLFKKYEGMKESGLEFRLSDIPDPRIVEKKKSKSIKKKSCSIKKAKMESESDSIRDVLEIQDISAACSNSDMLAWQYFFEQQLKRFEAFMQQQLIAIYEFQQFKSEIEEKQAKERYKESRRKQMPFKRESFTTQLVKKKSKSANITEVAKISDLSTAGFNSAQKKNKPASISKGHETSNLSVANINSVKRKSKSVNITEAVETPDLSTVEFNSAQKKNKPASISKGHETSDLSVANINSVKRKSKSVNVTQMAETPDLSTAEFNSAQKKKKPASIRKLHETSELSIASIISELNMGTENWNEEHPVGIEYDNEGVKETRSKEESLMPSVVLEDNRKIQTQKKNKPPSISKGHETPDLSVANINSVIRKSKSPNVTEAVETPDLYTAEFNSAQKKRKPASISKVHETSELSVANINSGLNMGTENWNEENPVGIENDNEVVKETRSKEWSLMPSVVLEDNRKIQIKKGKFAHVTQVAETPDLSTAEFNSAQKKRKPASISKVHETSELSVANINSELNMGTENWNEEHPVGIEYDNEVVKETRSKEGSLMPSVVLEDNRKFQTQKKNKPPSISKGHETPDLSVANINSVKRKSKSGNITEAVETPNLSTAEFNSAQKKNKSASISKGHETSDLSVANINSVKRKSKSANITEAVETPDLSTAGFNSAQKKRKPASISKVHETSEVSVASINSELNVDNSSRKEDVLDNQSLKKSRFKKGCVPSADHITKSSSRKSVFSNADESFKCVNNVDKVSVNALAKSWKPSNRFKKHLWYGIVPVCSLTRSPQTSSRSILDFSLVSAMPPVPRPLSPLSPETR